MKRILCIIFSIFFLVAFPVSAHMLKIDRDMSGVFHVDPEDDPVVGEPAYLHFTITDKTNKFSFDACDCRVAIKNNGTTLFNQVFSTDTPISYVFPERALYTIEVTGSPRSAGTFQDFDLKYDLRVDRTSFASSATTNAMVMPMTFVDHLRYHFLHTILIVVLIAAIAIIYYSEKRKGNLKK